MDIAQLRSIVSAKLEATQQHIANCCTEGSDLNCHSYNKGRESVLKDILRHIDTMDTWSTIKLETPHSPDCFCVICLG